MENRAGAWKISPILSAGTGKPAVKHVLAVICLVFLCFLLYSNTFGNGFVMDDLIVVENNPFIASWSNLKHFTDPSEYFMASGERTYRPVTTLSYFFDHALWRYYPGGYHFTNTVLHAVNGVLVYFILLYMLKRCKMTGLATSGERRTVDMVPLIVSLLFISHPAQTEGVNFIGGRHDILMTFFYLASLLSYLKASSDPLRSGIKYYLLSLALFGLSCFAKETGITLPAVLVLIDAFTAPQDLKQDFWKKRIVIYTLFASVALFYVYIRSVRMVMPGEFVDTGGERFPALAWMFMNYLRILLFPARLSAEYGAGPGYPTQIPATFAQPEAYLPAAIVLGLAGAVIFSRRRAPMVFFGCAWFFITFLPASNIIVQIISFPVREKYIYLPAVGFYIALTFLMLRIAENFMEKGFPAKKVKMILAAFVGSLVALYSARTSARNMDWKDGVKLWSVTAVSSPGSYRAYYNLGMSYEYERGDTEKAVEAFKKSLERYDLPATHNALGMVYLRNKRYQEALTEFIRANKGDPGLGSVYCHLGQLYLETGDPDKAIEILEKGFMDAREEFPYYDPIPRADMRAILGKAFFEKKDHKRAISELKASLAIRPGDVDVCYCLGRCYASEGMLKDSEKIFIQALRSDPGNVAIRYALANVYLRSKEFDKAEKEYLRILDIEPDYSDARNNLANIYYARGMVDMAVKEYNRVLEADPSHFKARNNLANVCLMNRDFDKAIVEYRRILDGRNSSAVVHFNLGLAYEGKGMLTKAYDEWMAALNIDPDFVPAEEALKRIGAKKGR